MKSIMKFFPIVLLVCIVGMIAWAFVTKYSTSTPASTLQIQKTATVPPDRPGKLDKQQVPPDTAQLDKQQVPPDSAIIPVPKKTIAPSLLGFLHREINSKELDIIRSMACLTTVNIEDAEWRANNLAAFLMAKMIVMQDVLDSIRAHQRFTKADSFNIFTRYLNDHYDEMMPKSVSSVSKKKSIKKKKKK